MKEFFKHFAVAVASAIAVSLGTAAGDWIKKKWDPPAEPARRRRARKKPR